ncbi:phosphonate C-P lyase system protein PhnH [Rhizobium sp.]
MSSLNESETDKNFADDHAENVGFRVILQAMSRPGLAVRATLPAACDVPGLPPAVNCVVRCLVDVDSPVWIDAGLDLPSARDFLTTTCGASLVADPADAAFALIGSPLEMPSFDKFKLGDQDYPDRSTTLVLCLSGLTGGSSVMLAGPGIATSVRIEPLGLPDWFWQAWDGNAMLYPRGVDILLTDGVSFIGLPRTTRQITDNVL